MVRMTSEQGYILLRADRLPFPSPLPPSLFSHCSQPPRHCLHVKLGAKFDAVVEMALEFPDANPTHPRASARDSIVLVLGEGGSLVNPIVPMPAGAGWAPLQLGRDSPRVPDSCNLVFMK